MDLVSWSILVAIIKPVCTRRYEIHHKNFNKSHTITVKLLVVGWLVPYVSASTLHIVYSALAQGLGFGRYYLPHLRALLQTIYQAMYKAGTRWSSCSRYRLWLRHGGCRKPLASLRGNTQVRTLSFCSKIILLPTPFSFWKETLGVLLDTGLWTPYDLNFDHEVCGIYYITNHKY